MKILLLLRQREVNYRTVADTLLTDAGFSAEVLRLANSAAIGCRFPSSSVLQALTVLGVPRISALTVSLAMCKFLKPVSNLPVMRLSWRHNLATALSSAELAPRYGIEPDYAYTFGLLHDIGRLGLLVAFPALCTQISARLSQEPSLDIADLERQEFGFDHRDIGVWVADQWRLPVELREVSLQHGSGSEPKSPLCRLIDEACGMANRLGFRVFESVAAPESDVTGVAERVRNHESEYGI